MQLPSPGSSSPGLDELFQTAILYHRAGRLKEAEGIYRRILSQDPHQPDVLHLLGVVATQAGHHDAAVDLIRRAVALKPDFAEAYNSLGVALRGAGQKDEAINCFERALKLERDNPEAVANLGNALRDKGQVDRAIACFNEALALRPDFAEIHKDLGDALDDAGRVEEAITSYDRALALRPDYVVAHYNRAGALRKAGKPDEAISSYRRALALKPDLAEAYNNLGILLRQSGVIDEAILCLNRAVALKPNYLEACNNLGSVLLDAGQVDQAIGCCKRVLAMKPDFAMAHSNLLMDLHYPDTYDPASVFQEHLAFGRCHAQPLYPANAAFGNDSDPNRRLRIGYVSRDFRCHSVACFLEPILANHDHRDHWIVCYDDHLHGDSTTQRLRGFADEWRDITRLSDESAADLIRRGRIDLLVDLAGHTASNRLLVFARRPAPVQVTYLGYPDTTGLSAIDYRLTDAHADPPGATESLHTEQLIRLPFGAWCFRPPDPSPAVGPPPGDGLGAVTFGSFNALAKITGSMIRCWSEILRSVPNARLLLKNRSFAAPAIARSTIEAFGQHGIAADRIELHRYETSHFEHLNLYGRVNIALDTFPYHGTTTTCEALWMGVPVITLAGNTHVSRVGVSLLSSVGLGHLIAESHEQYARIAIDLAGETSQLAKLRWGLRQRMLCSPCAMGRASRARLRCFIDNCGAGGVKSKIGKKRDRYGLRRD